MATTISRTAMTDDDGTLTTGTIFNNAWKTALYDQIDALFAGALSIGGGLTTTAAISYINDSSNAKMTAGWTINLGAATDEGVALKGSGVAHGMTTQAETDTFLSLGPAAGSGGFQLNGWRAAGSGFGAIRMTGAVVTAVNTTKSTGGRGIFEFQGSLASGTGLTAIGADGNIAVFTNDGTTEFILDGEGDSHQNVGTAWTNFDDQDDVALLHALSAGLSRRDDPLKQNFGRFLSRHRGALQRAKIVTFNRDGHHFINWSRTHMLTIGAVRQLGLRVQAAEAALASQRAEWRTLTARLHAS